MGGIGGLLGGAPSIPQWAQEPYMDVLQRQLYDAARNNCASGDPAKPQPVNPVLLLLGEE